MSFQDEQESTIISPESEVPAASEEPEEQNPRTPLNELQAGMKREGIVRNLQPYGAFVDIGAERDGLLHISQVGEGFVQRLEDVLQVGQDITVWVRDVDERRGRIRLTTRVPGQTLVTRRKLGELNEGAVLEGRVCSITQFGVFVDIGAETDGLVHISELSNSHVDHPSDVVSRGERVRVRVLAVDKVRRRIGLTMKGVDESGPATDFTPASKQSTASTTEDLPTAVEMAFRMAQSSAPSENKEPVTSPTGS